MYKLQKLASMKTVMCPNDRRNVYKLSSVLCSVMLTYTKCGPTAMSLSLSLSSLLYVLLLRPYILRWEQVAKNLKCEVIFVLKHCATKVYRKVRFIFIAASRSEIFRVRSWVFLRPDSYKEDECSSISHPDGMELSNRPRPLLALLSTASKLLCSGLHHFSFYLRSQVRNLVLKLTQVSRAFSQFSKVYAQIH